MAASSVDEFISGLEHPRIERLSSLRASILAIGDQVTDSIKWNAPNFLVDGEDRATFRIAPRDTFQLILHRGAAATSGKERPRIADPAGLLQWRSDDRAIIELADASDEQVLTLVRSWFAAA